MTNALAATDASLIAFIWLIQLTPFGLIAFAIWAWLENRKQARKDAAWEAAQAPVRIQRAKDRMAEEELRYAKWVAAEQRRARRAVLTRANTERKTREDAALVAAWAELDAKREAKRGHLRDAPLN